MKQDLYSRSSGVIYCHVFVVGELESRLLREFRGSPRRLSDDLGRASVSDRAILHVNSICCWRRRCV